MENLIRKGNWMAMDRGTGGMKPPAKTRDMLAGPFFWLSAFYFVYCIRPEDWIPGLHDVPLAKLTALPAIVALLLSTGRVKRGFRDLPKEGFYLLLLVGVMLLSAVFSPVWRGGAFFRTLDFAKVWVVWALTYFLITNFKRLRHVIFIQSGSVAVISVVSVIKGHSHPRLEGVLGGIYSNPNDLAFAIVLSLPFCLAFMLSTKSIPRIVLWTLAMLCMAAALFLTASRAGFITLVISGSVCLWHFAVKGRRPLLVIAVVFIGTALLVLAGKTLKDRFLALSGEGLDTKLETSAYGSFEDRRFLMLRALEGMEHYPLLGIGTRNFTTYSGVWREVHVSYLQIGVEGGIPALILYLMFFARGFANLRLIRRMKNLDAQTMLFVGALHSSLIGFTVGACFAPEAYQFFPYFAVAYTSVLLAMVQMQEAAALSSTCSPHSLLWRHAYGKDEKGESGKAGVVTILH
jgi:O-antigen ligase